MQTFLAKKINIFDTKILKTKLRATGSYENERILRNVIFDTNEEERETDLLF